MTASLDNRLQASLDGAAQSGTYKRLRGIEGPIGPRVRMAGRGEVALLSSNDYLGLANHPTVVAAAKAGLERFGAGTASVRFICGTLTIHAELEHALATFLRKTAAITYSSCWAANTGLIPTITQPGDVILSDELNHASIIDGCRMAANGVIRQVYRHGDVAHLRELLIEHRTAGEVFIITDGVFSMEGDLAPLPEIVALSREFGATIVVDDSHGLGVLGDTGRGTAEHFGVLDDVDIITGTLGKALGAGTGGFVAASAATIDTLVQRSRPHLFSNAIPGSVASASLAALRILDDHPEFVSDLRRKVRLFRNALSREGITAAEGESAIVPVIVRETARAISLADRLLDRGVFVTGFGHPVVPEGMARLRFQLSRAHPDDLIEMVARICGEEFSARGLLPPS